MKNLIQHIKNRIQIEPQDEEIILSKFHLKRVSSKETLLKEGEVCNRLSYVDKGCLRVYAIDDNGVEKNVFFTVEDWWTVDLKSFIEQSPARFYIDTIEECELFQIKKTDFEELLAQLPKLEKWFRLLLQNALISSENRISYKSSLNVISTHDQML